MLYIGNESIFHTNTIKMRQNIQYVHIMRHTSTWQLFHLEIYCKTHNFGCPCYRFDLFNYFGVFPCCGLKIAQISNFHVPFCEDGKVVKWRACEKYGFYNNCWDASAVTMCNTWRTHCNNNVAETKLFMQMYTVC